MALSPLPCVLHGRLSHRTTASLAEARAFVDDAMRLGRPPAWRDISDRLRAVRSEEEAIEVIGALRELLELEDLLVPPKLPLGSPHKTEH